MGFREDLASKSYVKKCQFTKPEIKFSGILVSQGGISIGPEKIQAIKDFPILRNKKYLQLFLGFCNFYRKFSQDHFSLLIPLSHSLKRGVPWEFRNTKKVSFAKTKDTFGRQVSLTHTDFGIPFHIQTDASIIGVGAELFRVDNENIRHMILFASRTLIPVEKNYTITDLESLGIVFACKKFWVYYLVIQLKFIPTIRP